MIPAAAARYQVQSDEEEKPWDNPLVIKANTEVPVVWVLNTYWNLDIPEDSQGWKVRCPLAYEHRDGGIDRQFRVYADSNQGHCFAIHGLLNPVRLWRIRVGSPTLLDAAMDLMRIYGIRIKQPSYQERIAIVRNQMQQRAEVTPSALIQALEFFLESLPRYAARQFDSDVLLTVNSVLEGVHEFCTQKPTLEEAQQWLREAQRQLSAQVNCPK